MTDVVYRRLATSDAGEALTVQRAAFVAEAWECGTAVIPPLCESLEEMRTELETNIGVGGFLGTRLVATARLTLDGPVGWISRVAVAPDLQGRGIGAGLLDAVEAIAPEGVDSFRLAAATKGNISMYEHRGFEAVGTTVDNVGIELTVMAKARS